MSALSEQVKGEVIKGVIRLLVAAVPEVVDAFKDAVRGVNPALLDEPVAPLMTPEARKEALDRVKDSNR